MPLIVAGLNHHTAPVEVRECFSFSDEQIKQGLKNLRAYDDIMECVILSTCNRTEIYAVVKNTNDALPLLADFLEQMTSTNYKVAQYLFHYAEEDCIRHLFKVVSSLDSLIVGEGQILSQVKQAYTIARVSEATSTVLNTLFNRAIAVGKKVRTETRIAYNAVSVSYAAVELAKKAIGDLTKANILIVGAGEMSELTAHHLVVNKVRTVFVSNRNYARAVELAAKFSGVAVPFEDFLNYAVDADIIITSTGAPHYIIKARDVNYLMAKRSGKTIIFIDIAVPRDVEPEVGAIAGAKLYNIDDLEAVIETNIKERIQEAEVAAGLIEEEVAKTIAKFRYLNFRPIFASLSDKVEIIRQRELKRALNKMPDITQEEQKIMEEMSNMLVRKLLRDPIVNINEAAAVGKEHEYLTALCHLFKLEKQFG